MGNTISDMFINKFLYICFRYSANFFYNSTADELIFKKLNPITERSETKKKVEEESIRVSDNESNKENNSSSSEAALNHKPVTTSGTKPIVNKHSLTSNYLPPPSIFNLHLDLNKTKTKPNSYIPPPASSPKYPIKHSTATYSPSSPPSHISSPPSSSKYPIKPPSATYLPPPPAPVSHKPPLISYMSPSLSEESFPSSSSDRPPSTSYISPSDTISKVSGSSSYKPSKTSSVKSSTESSPSISLSSASLNSSYSFYIPPKPVIISSYGSSERNNHKKISLIRNNGTKPITGHEYKETKESIKSPYLHKNRPKIYDILKVRIVKCNSHFLFCYNFVLDNCN